MSKKIKVEIKSIWGTLLFEHEAPDNTLAKTLREANLRGANLYGADLRGANLRVANLYGADLRGANLRGANLYGADLRGANLYGAYLRGANLRGANLYGADLRGANLYGADLYGADLRGANLYGADLRGANLYGANLRGANLYGADLRGANLRGANLYGANLRGAKNSELAIAMTRILPEGQLIGWKKCRDNVIVKLQIPAKAKRSHAFGRKCRAEYAKVLEIIGADEAVSTYDPSFRYKKGDTIRPVQGWDENWTEECAPGIHFFITREEAENYA
jgi:hypothetical protein